MEDIQLRAVHALPVADIRHALRQRAEFREYAAGPWLRIRGLRAHVALLYAVIALLAALLLHRF